MRLGWTLAILLAVVALPAGPAAGSASRDEKREILAILGSAEEALASDRPERARELFDEAASRARTFGETNLLRARAVDRLADLDRRAGRLDEAAFGYRSTATMWVELLGDGQPRLATTLHNLGVVYLEQNRLEDAERAFEQALAIWERRLGSDSDEAGNSRDALSVVRSRRQR
jgi:tetratricopeptide (TPR) repeat protein